jgi:hypothetical protein
MHPHSLFSLAEHLERLSKDGGPLEVLAGTVEFERFRPLLVKGIGIWGGLPYTVSPRVVRVGEPILITAGRALKQLIPKRDESDSSRFGISLNQIDSSPRDTAPTICG